jgi:hypothetical protein
MSDDELIRLSSSLIKKERMNAITAEPDMHIMTQSGWGLMPWEGSSIRKNKYR